MAPFPRTQPRDPRQTAPIGAYLTDGKRLVRVLQVDHSGATVEDVATETLGELGPVDLMQKWRRIRPDGSVTATSWRAEHAHAA